MELKKGKEYYIFYWNTCWFSYGKIISENEFNKLKYKNWVKIIYDKDGNEYYLLTVLDKPKYNYNLIKKLIDLGLYITNDTIQYSTLFVGSNIRLFETDKEFKDFIKNDIIEICNRKIEAVKQYLSDLENIKRKILDFK